MFDINHYCHRLQTLLLDRFGDRLCYLGLQGSYLRGEATAASDIDMVVVLEELTLSDLNDYRQILEQIGEADRACGFVCARTDLTRWNPLEVCRLLHTTRDLYGCLADLLPDWSAADEWLSCKLGLDDLYHTLCHSYLHGSSAERAAALPGLYKSAFFLLQHLQYLEDCRVDPETAVFVLSKASLQKRLQGSDRAVLDAMLSLPHTERPDPEWDYALLFDWCRETAARLQTAKEAFPCRI